MDHMNHMQHMHEMHGASSFPFLALLAGFFLVGALFYLFRFCNRSYVSKVNGYHDRENEFWHGACLLGMVSCLTPAWFAIPDLVWQIGFAIGTGWYLVRAFTYGRSLPFNKQWYDFAHAAMLFGMWWMFAAPVSGILVTVVFTAYWTWFGSYYAVRIYNDFKNPHWLSFGQDIAHFTMALVMALMMLYPATFMGSHHHMSAAGMDNMPMCTGADPVAK
ncbi:MAG: hypothetical protein JSS86_13885 [Cyanobacteria bacterium SZAS LIN-2]|nr:hypothetical protein [Cyanobacteria bacterium SZAS LIN-3]MBS1997404.1 hypothetical protein [Cyanobacteria bacterium SZAS LIN-2]MBS2007427.1 hypothetical protein [Cyanobacteria bacterium SZAS TMP-1]